MVESARQAFALKLRDGASSEHGPSLGHNMSSGEWLRMMLARPDANVAEAAPREAVGANVMMLRELGMLDRELDLAIDAHLIPRYDVAHGPDLFKQSRARHGLSDTLQSSP